MNKKIIVLLICLIGISTIKVKADSVCSYKDQAALNSEVANIKAIYEERTGLLDPSTFLCEEGMTCETEYNYFEISILNISPNFYVVVTDERDNSKKIIKYSDLKDGVASFDFKSIMNTNTFTFDVYSSENTDCPDEKYRTFTLRTPRKNIYANYILCEDKPDYFLCQKYVDFEDIGFYEFMDKMDEYETEQERIKEEQKNASFVQKALDFIKDNKVPVIIISSLVLIGVGTTSFVVIKKRKKSVL